MTWTADRLSQLATGYWPAAALNAAAQLGVFDALDAGRATADAVAGRTGCDAARLAGLLDALAATGLLAKTEQTYDLADGVRPLLSRQSPTCLLDALAYNVDLYRRWAGLADVVRGHGPADIPGQAGGDPAATRRFVLGMEAKARVFAPALADAIDLDGVDTLLDVAAGPGTLTRLLAERRPTLRATLLDLPPVLAVAKELGAASTVADRLAYHAADYRADALPGPFDAVVYAGALHQETPATAAAVAANLFASLRPGGRVWVIDLMLDASRTSPAFSAMFQLNMMLLRPGARVFGVEEAVRLLADAGFVDVQSRPIAGTPYCVAGGVIPFPVKPLQEEGRGQP